MRSSPPAPQSLPPYSNSPRSCSPPPPPQYTELTRVHVDVQHAPLNLSLSSAPPIPPTTPPTRPSVITSANTSPPRGSSESYRPDVEHQDSSSYRTVTLKNGSSHETAAQVSDEAIEEHFRRSLGKCYGEQPSPSKKPAVHVSEKICDVDDHFARALGDQMWTEIKARTEPPPLDALSGTVDAHFAKALGAAMWKKLKAENKLVDDVGSAQEQQPPQQSQTHHQEQQQQQQQPQLQASSHNRKSPSASPLQTSLVT